ncbi:PREDICTED: disintegrin and metalloproteinase domain-containing protein 32-like [Haliaeetus leucocephalus]|uniref:disintegrin and metalloproteinase domain-containing protein 32-like n=1 Tax=Haliaeetus leucocephalus TaxID=52644 RepID=UPI00053CE1DB|nr:PREDICTED: disintegrin and metalloproteinase domain-containing protein 32-like [Haliaeetus leucocephalus]
MVPLRLPANATGEADTVSYVLRIEGRPYTVHLRQHVFLSEDFRIYMSDEKGSLRSDLTPIKGGCHYRGYVEGFPSSAVTLSTCSGLRGLLQFENVSYGPLSAAARSPKYLKVYVVLDKALYNYMGSDTNAATQKIIQVFNLVNNMFNPLNVTIVLSSLELWTEENKISTAGEADDLLQQFLQWKQSHLALGSYDIAYLLLYRDQAAFVGATAPGKVCQRDAAGAVAVYQGAVTPESFSVLLAQLLGRSLGISYDDSRDCRCPGRVCLMSPEALHVSGAKAFSSCSIGDFKTFLKQNRDCPFIRHALHQPSYRAAVCGNGVIEPGEQCDCGAAEACALDKCCTPQCNFKPGVKCSLGLCCEKCQFKQKNLLCRPAADAQCDLAEFCNGSSASCPPDLYVQDGHGCEHGTGYCYKGRCQSPDLQCRRLYGRGSKNAPVACYEELNSQRDRFGHCGFQPRQGYKSCAWRNLRCGKLICTYPYSTPFPSEAAAVLYVQVREHLCISLDYLNAPARLDPLLVPPGTKCGSGKVCINNTCHPHSVLGYDCDSKVKCHGHGVCNNKRHCHCHPGWKPPDCLQKGSGLGGSVDSGLQLMDGGLPMQRALEDMTLAWPVLGSCLLLLLLTGAVCLVLRRRAQPPNTEGPAAEEGSDGRETDVDTEPGPGPGGGL